MNDLVMPHISQETLARITGNLAVEQARHGWSRAELETHLLRRLNEQVSTPAMDDQLFIPGMVKPESEYVELQRLGKKLGIPTPMVFVDVAATNPDGSQGDRYKDRSRTFNRNFWNILYGLFTNAPAGTATFGAGFLAGKDTGGTVRAQNYGASAPQPSTGLATATSESFGIVVGTGTTAESFEHNTMATLILSGSSAGKLAYATQGATAVSYNAGTKVWTATLTRIFNNNSGGAIVVAETGWYAVHASTGFTFLTCRDLLGATVNVLNAGQLTVTYTVTLTFPA